MLNIKIFCEYGFEDLKEGGIFFRLLAGAAAKFAGRMRNSRMPIGFASTLAKVGKAEWS